MLNKDKYTTINLQLGLRQSTASTATVLPTLARLLEMPASLPVQHC